MADGIYQARSKRRQLMQRFELIESPGLDRPRPLPVLVMRLL